MRKIISPVNLDLKELTGNNLKDLIQDDVVTHFEELSHLICEITTGFGKTNIAIKAIKKNPKAIVNIIVPKENLKNQWITVLTKNNIFLSNVNVYVINSYTMNPEKIPCLDPDILIVDEAHRALNEDSIFFSNLLKLAPNSKKLLLSASIDEKHKKYLDELGLVNYYQITRNWAFQQGLVPYHTPINIPIDLTASEMSDYLQAEDVIQKESKYLAIGRIFEVYGANEYQIMTAARIMGVEKGVIYGKLKRLKAAYHHRKQILYNAANKKDILTEMLKYINEKVLIFTKSIDAANFLADGDDKAVIYHSKLKKSKKNDERGEVIKAFESNQKPHLYSVDSIKEGYDPPKDCAVVIRTAYEKGERDTIQIRGRVGRFDEDNLNKQSFLFNYYVKSFMARGREIKSKELEWLIANQTSEYNVIWFDSATDAINYVKETFK